MEMHYYDPDYYTGVGNVIPGTVGKGWYYFTDWTYGEDIGGNPQLTGSSAIWQKSGKMFLISRLQLKLERKQHWIFCLLKIK